MEVRWREHYHTRACHKNFIKWQTKVSTAFFITDKNNVQTKHVENAYAVEISPENWMLSSGHVPLPAMLLAGLKNTTILPLALIWKKTKRSSCQRNDTKTSEATTPPLTITFQLLVVQIRNNNLPARWECKRNLLDSLRYPSCLIPIGIHHWQSIRWCRLWRCSRYHSMVVALLHRLLLLEKLQNRKDKLAFTQSTNGVTFRNAFQSTPTIRNNHLLTWRERGWYWSRCGRYETVVSDWNKTWQFSLDANRNTYTWKTQHFFEKCIFFQ